MSDYWMGNQIPQTDESEDTEYTYEFDRISNS